MEDDCSDDYDDERTQLMHDEETRDTSSVVDQKKTVVAQVPVVYNVEGGGHTILFAQQVTVQVGQMVTLIQTCKCIASILVFQRISLVLI